MLSAPSSPRIGRTAPPAPLAGYALALVATGLAVSVAIAAERWLGLRDPSVWFMLVVLLVALRTRTGPALVAALACALAYNFFFIEPRHTLHVQDRHALLLLALFAIAASLAGQLAARLAMQVQALHQAQRRAAARQQLAQRLADADNEARASGIASEALRDTFGAETWIRIDASEDGASMPASTALSVLRRTGEGREVDHRETTAQHGWWFLPLQIADRSFGAVGLKLDVAMRPLDEIEREAVREMVHDLAQSLRRLRLAAELERERVRGEAERLRSALLSSVSHDLRTPLATIRGAAETLDAYAETMPGDDRAALLEMIRSESERLDRYIRNLLDMTRLGPGAPQLRRDWIGVDELVGAVLGRIQRQHPGQRFELRLDPALEPIHVQPALLEQALLNVVENAATFSPAGESITLSAQLDPDRRLRLVVADRGPGIPPAERSRIFDLFYSVTRGDRGGGGTGLGLAISRGALVAHGGEVEARAGSDGIGTEIHLILPAQAQAPMEIVA